MDSPKSFKVSNDSQEVKENLNPNVDVNVFEQYSQVWNDTINEDIPKNKVLKMLDATTQTEKDVEQILKIREASNEAFGVFVGKELSSVPEIKRRVVMYEIIKVFEHSSK
ncbi:hypothetical protein evm_013993 [Chilo suppressalis]|nr:hypothetical protein evm_013993 [Chilo suppressalis]